VARNLIEADERRRKVKGGAGAAPNPTCYSLNLSLALSVSLTLSHSLGLSLSLSHSLSLSLSHSLRPQRWRAGGDGGGGTWGSWPSRSHLMMTEADERRLVKGGGGAAPNPECYTLNLSLSLSHTHTLSLYLFLSLSEATEAESWGVGWRGYVGVSTYYLIREIVKELTISRMQVGVSGGGGTWGSWPSRSHLMITDTGTVTTRCSSCRHRLPSAFAVYVPVFVDVFGV